MAPSCILAVKTDLQHTEDMRPVTAIPKSQEAGGFKLRCLVVFCDVIRQIRSIDCSIHITLNTIYKHYIKPIVLVPEVVIGTIRGDRTLNKMAAVQNGFCHISTIVHTPHAPLPPGMYETYFILFLGLV